MFSRFQWSLFIGTIRWSIGCFWKKTIQYTMLNIELVSGRSGSHSQVDRLWNQMDQDSWIRNQEFTLDQKWTRQPEIRWWPFEDRFKPLKRVTIWSKKLVWKHRQRKDWSGSSGSLVVGGASCDTTWPRRKIDQNRTNSICQIRYSEIQTLNQFWIRISDRKDSAFM